MKVMKQNMTIKEYCNFWDIPCDDMGNVSFNTHLYDFQDDTELFKKQLRFHENNIFFFNLEPRIF